MEWGLCVCACSVCLREIVCLVCVGVCVHVCGRVGVRAYMCVHILCVRENVCVLCVCVCVCMCVCVCVIYQVSK